MGTPSPWLNGIMGLGEKREVIYGAQSVTGKILETKNLASEYTALTYRYRHDDDLLFCLNAQGQMSHRDVEKICQAKGCATTVSSLSHSFALYPWLTPWHPLRVALQNKSGKIDKPDAIIQPVGNVELGSRDGQSPHI